MRSNFLTPNSNCLCTPSSNCGYESVYQNCYITSFTTATIVDDTVNGDSSDSGSVCFNF